MQEWFKNRRKKDKLGQERMLGRHLPKGRRGQRSSTGSIGGISEIGQSHSLEQQVAMAMEGGVAMETEGGVTMGQQIEIQQQQAQVATIGMCVCVGGGGRGRSGWEVGVVYHNLLIFISSPSGHPTLQTPMAIPTEVFTTSKQLH